MSLVLDKWKVGQCRIENGIFFPNDEYIPLSNKVDDAISIGTRTPIQTLIDENPNYWANCDIACEYFTEEHIAIGGGGSWEGEGFVALIDNASQDIQWILQSEDIEIVEKIVIEQGIIKASALECGYRISITIPVTNPEAAQITFTRDD